MNETKEFTCRVCHTKRTTDEFMKDKRMPHGIDYMCNECRRERRRTNGEYLTERARKYQKRNGDAVMLITADQLESLLTNHSCSYCGDQLTNENATIDHVFSLSQQYGGCNIAGNIVQSCRSCNSAKRDLHVADFYHRSDKFTPELWQSFARNFGSRLMRRELTELEGRQMARNLIEEADDLRRNAERKEVAANG